MFDWYKIVVFGTEEAVEAAGPPVLNLEIVVVHVVRSAAAGGWDGFLLAVGDTFLVKTVAGLVGTKEVASAAR